MTAQADLRVEAAHLRRFLHNFRALRGAITAPAPLEPWVTEAVLVESFEPGLSVDRYIQEPAPFNTKVRAAAACLYPIPLPYLIPIHYTLH